MVSLDISIRRFLTLVQLNGANVDKVRDELFELLLSEYGIVNVEECAYAVIDSEFGVLFLELLLRLLVVLGLHPIIEHVECVHGHSRRLDLPELLRVVRLLLVVLSLLPVVLILLVLCNLLTLSCHILRGVGKRITDNDDHGERESLVVDNFLVGVPETDLNSFVAPTTLAD